MRRRRLFIFALITAYGLALAFLANTRMTQGLDADRYALMESIVERSSFNVDMASFPDIDRIKIGQHYYSGKSPVLSFAGAAVYYVLYHGFGWSFRTHAPQVVRVMIVIFVIIPVCVLLWQFQRCAPPHPGRSAHAALGNIALLAIASLLFPYSLCFTNHPLAACLLFAGFAALFPSGHSYQPRWILAGFLAGASVAIDLIPGAIFLAALLAISVSRRQFRNAAWLAAGAAVPALVHGALNEITLGSWIPAYLISGALHYEGSIWRPDSAAAQEYEQFAGYGPALYHYALGHRSVFLFMPLLLYGLLGAVRAAWTGRRSQTFAAPTAAVAAFLGTVLLVPRFSLGLAGGSYGPRHIIPAVPLIYAFICGGLGYHGSTWKRGLFWVAVCWSAAIAWIGALNPWAPLTLSVYAPLDVLAAKAAKWHPGWSSFAETIVEYTAPSPSFGFYELGRNYAEAGKAPEAISAYVRSRALNPKRTLTLYALGVAAGQAGRVTLAIDAFRALTKLEPENAGAWANLGMTLLQTPDREGARSALERGFELNPRSRAAVAGLVRWHSMAGDAGQARLYAERLRALDAEAGRQP